MPSTAVAHIEYNVDTRILTIMFVSGAVYAYYEVPEEVYAAFRQSGSKGRYLNKAIKGSFAFKKLQ